MNFVWNYLEKKKKVIGALDNFTIDTFIYIFMDKGPSIDNSLLILSLYFKVILRRFEVFFFFLVWSGNAALFKRLMENHSTLPM